MGIREIFNSLEATLKKQGFPLSDADEVPQVKKASIRITEIPGDQQLRGTIGSGKVRLVFNIEIVLTYNSANDKRIERKVAEEAEDMIVAVYGDVNLTNHHYITSTISRDARQGLVTNTIRFDWQSQAIL